MLDHTEAFIGNAVAIAEGGRSREVRYLGEFDATEAAMRKLIAKLRAKYQSLTFCYEEGPRDMVSTGCSRASAMTAWW